MTAPRLVAFDLDDTLAPSKSAIDPRIGELLIALAERVEVAIISGGQLGQFTAQVGQAGRVGFILQGQLKRAALLADQVQVGSGINRPLTCVFTHLSNRSFTREAARQAPSEPP